MAREDHLLDQVSDDQGLVHAVRQWGAVSNMVYTACKQKLASYKRKRLVGLGNRLGANPMDGLTCVECKVAIVEAHLDRA